MALSIGELTGYVDLDASRFEGGLSAVTGLLGRMGGKWGTILAGVGVAGGTVFAGALASAIDGEVVKDKLSAQLGLSKTESKRIGGVAGKLYSQAYGDSMGEVSEAIGYVIRDIKGMRGASEKQLAGVSKKVMTTANVFDQDLGGVTQAVGQMMRTGLAKNATQALNLITRGFQTGGNKADDLLETINEYSTSFRTIGLDGKTSLGLINQGLRNGARDADQVADALKEFGIRAQDGSEASAKGFRLIGLNADKMSRMVAKGGPSAKKALDMVLDGMRNMKDPTKRNAAAVALFGAKAEDMGKALFALDVDTAAKSLGKVSGAAKKAGDTFRDNAQTNLTIFWRTLKTKVVTFVGGHVLPVLTKLTGLLVQALGPAFKVLGKAVAAVGKVFGRVVKFMEDHKTTTKVLAGIITTLLIPAMIAVGVNAMRSAKKQVVAWVMTQKAAIKSATKQGIALMATGAKWVLAGTKATLQAARMAAAWIVAMGPVAWVIAGVVALVALIIANWDKIKKWTSKIWSAVSKFIGKAWGKIKSVVSKAVSAVVKFVSKAWNKAKSIVSKIGRAIGKVVSKAWNGIKKAVTAVLKVVRKVITTYFKAYAKVIRTVLGTARKIVSTVWNAIKTVIGNVLGRIRSVVSNVFGRVRDVVRNILQRVRSIVSNVWGGIRSRISSVLSTIRSIVSNVFGRVRDAVSNILGRVRSVVGNIWSAIRSRIGSAVRGALSTVRSVFGSIVSAVRSKVSSVLSVVRGIPGKIKGAFSSAGSWLLDAGKAIIRGLIDGISDMIGSLKDKLSGVTGMIPDWKGPMDVDARLLTPNGEAIMSGLMRGVDRKLPALRKQLQGITHDIPAMQADARNRNASTRVERTIVERQGPLIGEVHQQPGESADQLAQRMWLTTRRRG